MSHLTITVRPRRSNNAVHKIETSLFNVNFGWLMFSKNHYARPVVIYEKKTCCLKNPCCFKKALVSIAFLFVTAIDSWHVNWVLRRQGCGKGRLLPLVPLTCDVDDVVVSFWIFWLFLILWHDWFYFLKEKKRSSLLLLFKDFVAGLAID
jgi:hypothetical protein